MAAAMVTDGLTAANGLLQFSQSFEFIELYLVLWERACPAMRCG